MIGETILHYSILDKLGAGGMGVVYKARDINLGRLVAIKFLSPHLALDPEAKERFRREARAAAALTHPHIATIYSVEEAEQGLFIVMEYVEGIELKKRIKESAIGHGEAVEYAIQIAEALQAAHRLGIVHRDVKSSNIMLTKEGGIKVTDFGLAKFTNGPELTKELTTTGTPAYMSPEQARGEVVDQRADLWSLGVVLFEMLTGRLPFPGDHEAGILYSILNTEPALEVSTTSGIPAGLEGIVRRLLAKEKEDRYRDAGELLADLHANAGGRRSSSAAPRRWPLNSSQRIALAVLAVAAVGVFLWKTGVLSHAGGGNWKGINESKPLTRIAVMPFANVRGDPQTDFLGFAFADQIIGTLAYVKDLQVRPSSAVRKYQTNSTDALTAGKELNVDYVLTGNYLREGDVVRLQVELVDAHTNVIAWREPLEVKYESAFKVQDLVTARITEGLKIHFTSSERKRMGPDIPGNPAAYEYYLRSLSCPITVEGCKLALDLLSKSLTLDSTYAPSYSETGFRLNILVSYGLGSNEEMRKSEKAFLKALSLNGDLLAALSNLANLYTEMGRTERSVELGRRMLAINPNYPSACAALGYAYRYAGMLEESEKMYDKALALDSTNSRFRSAGITYFCLGKYEKAKRAFDLDRGSPFCLAWTGFVLASENRSGEATQYFDRAIAMEPKGLLGFWAAAWKAYVETRREDGLRASRSVEATNPTDGEVFFYLAVIHGAFHDTVGCERTLALAIEHGYYNYPSMMHDPFLEAVRDAPSIRLLIQKAGQKHEAFKKEFFEN